MGEDYFSGGGDAFKYEAAQKVKRTLRNTTATEGDCWTLSPFGAHGIRISTFDKPQLSDTTWERKPRRSV